MISLLVLMMFNDNDKLSYSFLIQRKRYKSSAGDTRKVARIDCLVLIQTALKAKQTSNEFSK